MEREVKTKIVDDPREAAEWLRAGGLVAFPTETVYGLGVDATCAAAVERLFRIKGRPGNNPLIVHLADLADLELAGRDIPDVARRLLEQFAPGPLTVVVPKRESIAPQVTAGLDTVGVRIPAEPRARELLRLTRLPIAAPSANRSGKPSSTTIQGVLEDFGDELDAILSGEPSAIGLESTVVDCTRDVPRVLRPGAVTLEQLRSVAPDITAAGRTVEPGENSPGRLHPHYQPLARVLLVSTPAQASAEPTAAYLGLHPHAQADRFGWYRVFHDPADYARNFYESLREVDRRGLRQVFCETAESRGIGEALMDRLARAAE
jgi:L-threonylcarbamoyladenylate synthase